MAALIERGSGESMSDPFFHLRDVLLNRSKWKSFWSLGWFVSLGTITAGSILITLWQFIQHHSLNLDSSHFIISLRSATNLGEVDEGMKKL